MDLLTDFAASAHQFLPLLVTVAVVVVVLAVTHHVLARRWQGRADAQFRFQLIMLVLTFIGLLAIVIALPIEEALRNQLLSLIGVLLSAAIALSSTTFIGNILAGIMLKAIRSARPGDFITIGDLTGRITEMDLLHTEVQTEFRDLVTVPNLTMVTQPLKVVRASGTIVTSEVSLGYDLPQSTIREHLCTAAEAAGLKDPFAHVRSLGDFSVSYRVAGLLEDVESLITARARLRESILDTLHAAGIEIVSPTFMITRASSPEDRVIPPVLRQAEAERERTAEEIAFDKADAAASIEEMRDAIAHIDERLSDATAAPAEQTRARLEAHKARLMALIAAAEERKNADENGR